MIHLRLILLFTFFCSSLFAQKTGIKGTITDQKGEPVSFASIGVEKQSTGTMANAEGKYQLELLPGKYKIYYQCIGYQTQAKEIDVEKGFSILDAQLTEVTIQMKEVHIASRNEDPAYGIIRKAIARAKINKMLLDSYTARVYIRGSGRILEIPFLLRTMAKSNGWDENTVFFTETLENLSFKQPNSYKETVIAARSTAGNVEIGQRFIKEDLYNPKYGSTISPLSPTAFRTYKFEYLGAFTDRGHEVFKIKVIPRLKGDNVWEGELYIIDQLWCIHSNRMTTVIEGIDISLNNLYAPLESIWLPVRVQQEFKGKVFGITFEAKYNSSISQYRIVKNEKLYADYKSLEQKIDDKISEEIKKPKKEIDLKAREKEEKKLMAKIAKTYVKEKFKEKLGLAKKEQKKEPKSLHIRSETNYSVDSNAHKKDSTYWQENRDVPLTSMEIKSFNKLDSIRVKEEKADSTKAKKTSNPNSFGISDLVLGKTFRFGKADSIKRKPVAVKYFSPLADLQFNAVEGYVANGTVWVKTYLEPSLSKEKDNRDYLQFGPTVRYSFGRNKFLGSGIFQYKFHPFEIQLTGGTEMRQINGDEPIAPWLNSIYALTDTRNFMKLYEQDFIQVKAIRKLTGRLELESGIQYANRIPVENSVSKGIWGTSKSFESNEVSTPFGIDATTNRSIALTWSGRIDWYPTLTSSISNERQYFDEHTSPRIRFQFRHAIPGVSNSTMDFTFLSLGYFQNISTTEQSELNIFGRASGFLRAGKTGQMDLAQVNGNQTNILTGNSLESFRNLPYYAFASQKATAEIHMEWLHNRLLLGWLSRKKTWREVVIANAMANPNQPVFYEIGYGIDKLFRFLRVEVVRSKMDGLKEDWSFRVGILKSFNISPGTFDKNTN